ncbi:hypothetical protein IEO21_01243 [Rhodonia placenta]|uniref:Zn(2)-C6 fungal-type domain-containing protein n=1 Tax=Rhodonia placenta TaxID=104341 RepID=A0A8H7PA66_9APHY|nr:hypothetical protein IEO21_01243 [Postia placenta]
MSPRRSQKCDGVRPVCGPCVRAETAQDCVYSDGPAYTAAQQLQEQVTRLEDRLKELQASAPGPIALHDPYETHRMTEASQYTTGLPPIPTHVIQTLIVNFSNYASELGFYLHVPRFLEAVSQPQADDLPKHTSTLLNTIYLLGAYLSNDLPTRALQERFLSAIPEHRAVALAEITPGTVMYILQAEILLANYYFAQDRTLESAYHCSAASAIVLACKLHHTRSARDIPGVFAGTMQFRLDPPADHVEEGERMNAFWVAYILDKCLSFALGSPSALTDEEEKGTQIDVPWPLDTSAYEQSILALHAKSVALFEYAAEMAKQVVPNTNQYPAGFGHLAIRLERFRLTLPSTDEFGALRAELRRRFLVIHMAIHCAAIQLWQPIEMQNDAISLSGRSISAARGAVEILRKSDVGAVEHIDPFVGVLLKIVADVLRRSLMRALSDHSSPQLSEQKTLCNNAQPNAVYAVISWFVVLQQKWRFADQEKKVLKRFNLITSMASTSASGNLGKGKACLVCRLNRQKKTVRSFNNALKCDGVRPICGQCIRSNMGAECGYLDEPDSDNIQALERHIAHLENHIANLEDPSLAPVTPMSNSIGCRHRTRVQYKVTASPSCLCAHCR